MDEAIWRERARKSLVSHGYAYLWEEIQDSLHQPEAEASSRAFTDSLLDALKEHANEDAGEILAGCACHASHNDLNPLRKLWEDTRDLELVHSKLQEHFIAFVRDYKQLDDGQIDYLTANGWGMAGILTGAKVTATKIPAMFHEYFAADDPVEKRYCYCHCPRVKELLREGIPVDPAYCHCGMGFYLDIWSYILGRPVKGEIRASIFDGDEVCSFTIDLA